MNFKVIIFALSLLVVTARGNLAQCKAVVSPPLPGIGNRCVLVKVPPRWSVQNLNMSAWSHHLRSADFSIEYKSADKMKSPLRTIGLIRTLDIEVGNDALWKYKANGWLNGVPFTTRSGLHGVLSVSHYHSKKTAWSLTIPSVTRKGIALVTVETRSSASRSDRELAYWILRRIRFVPPKVAPSLHSTPEAKNSPRLL